MKAQVKCSYADLYHLDPKTNIFLKASKKFRHGRVFGRLSGKYKTWRGRDYLQLESIDNSELKNYYWVKKVAINIVDVEDGEDLIFKEELEKKAKNNNLILPLALVTLLLD